MKTQEVNHSKVNNTPINYRPKESIIEGVSNFISNLKAEISNSKNKNEYNLEGETIQISPLLHPNKRYTLNKHKDSLTINKNEKS